MSSSRSRSVRAAAMIRSTSSRLRICGSFSSRRTAPLPGGWVQLEFSDTGVGIPPEHLRDIFNPFFTTKAPGQGTGLGLSVVHSVVKRYNGDIQVRSQLSRGTTFTIEFPCTCCDRAPM